MKKIIFSALIFLVFLNPTADSKVEYLDPPMKVEHKKRNSKRTKLRIRKKSSFKKNRLKRQNGKWNFKNIKTNPVSYKFALTILMVASWVLFGLTAILALIFLLFYAYQSHAMITIFLGLIFILFAILCHVLLGKHNSKSINTNTQTTSADNKEVVAPKPEAPKVVPVSNNDVLYLKNGSIIKCEVLELIPNEKVKILTNDGSIFVFKMSEVIKLAKE